MSKALHICAAIFCALFMNNARASIGDWNNGPSGSCFGDCYYQLSAGYNVADDLSIAGNETLTLGNYKLMVSNKLDNYGNVFGTTGAIGIELGDGAIFNNHGTVQDTIIFVMNHAIISNGPLGTIGSPVKIGKDATLVHQVFGEGELGSFAIKKDTGGKFNVEILDAAGVIDLGAMKPGTNSLSISGSKVLLPNNAPLSLSDSLNISNSTLVLYFEASELSDITEGWSKILFIASDIAFSDLKLETNADLDLFGYEFIAENGKFILRFTDAPEQPPVPPKTSEPEEPDVPGYEIEDGGDEKTSLSIINPLDDIRLFDAIDSARADKIDIRGARLLVDEKSQALRLDSVYIDDCVFVLNITQPNSISVGKFITIFISDELNISKNNTLEHDLPVFYDARLVQIGESYGILIEKNPNYNGENRQPGSGLEDELSQAMRDYALFALAKNPDGAAARRLDRASNPESHDRILLEFFHAFQHAAMDMSAAVQKSFGSLDADFDSDSGHQLFAEALRVSTASGAAYGISAGISGVFGIHAASSNLNYLDGGSAGKIFGARINPRVPVGRWTFKGEIGYQSARFEEDKNSFGVESGNRIDIESKIFGLAGEYRIPFGASWSLSPMLRYNLQNSKVVGRDDDLFFDRHDKSITYSPIDFGGKIQYKVCVVGACDYFGTYALAGHDFIFGSPVWNYGAFAKFSIDSDSTWLDVSFSSERFGSQDSYIFGAKLRLVF
jgi:hypothetical protein